MSKLNTQSRANKMSDWKTLKSEVVYETPWIKVRRDEVLNHNDKPMTYSVIELQRPSVLIVAEQDGKILVQKSFHYTLNKETWEIPAGGADEQDLLAAAKRELREETGLKSEDWTDLGRYYHAIGLGNLPYSVFLARNVQRASDATDEYEQITEQKFFDLSEVEKMIASGDLAEGAHISAIYLAKIHGLTEKSNE
jgi:8-oxo-dGTP pyrophosphatase MutT (NUDIX family)